MFSALRFATLVKLPDASLELVLLSHEIPFIGDHKVFVSWTIFGKRLVVGKDGPDKGPEYTANEQPRQEYAPGSDLERSGAVRHHLRDIHFAPLMLRGGLQFVDTSGHFCGCFRLK